MTKKTNQKSLAKTGKKKDPPTLRFKVKETKNQYDQPDVYSLPDVQEEMIVTQMVALHNQMMDYMKQSTESWQAKEFVSRYLKINRQFIACLYGLQRYRNRGQQSVVFQNVNVGPDGRAIVGCVQSPE